METSLRDKIAPDHGGQAFPGPSFTHAGLPIGHDMGMTLRDWFAGQALAGISAISGDGFSLSPQDSATWAYDYADAMIAARKGGA